MTLVHRIARALVAGPLLLAFLAGGAEPVAAAVAAVYYHGLAADLAAETGARGLLASDVVERLREVFPD